jgi:glutamate transport system permease protein
MTVNQADPATGALFDELGPRGRKRLRWATVIASIVVLGLVVAVIAQLAHVGQLAGRLWAPLGEWPYQRFLLGGLVTTLEIGLSAAAMSMVVGTAAAIGRLSGHRWVSLPCTAAIELFRSIPLILLVYFFLIGGPMVGIYLPPYWELAIPIVLHAGSVFAEIVRAGVNSLDRGQTDAGLALGLRRQQVLTLVVLPQVFRNLRPALVSQLIRTLKESSLGYVVSYPELLNRGQVLGEYTANYIVINFALSRLAELLDRPKSS